MKRYTLYTGALIALVAAGVAACDTESAPTEARLEAPASPLHSKGYTIAATDGAVTGGVGQTQSTGTVVWVDRVCDFSIVEPGGGAGLPAGTYQEVPKGATIRLVQKEYVCEPAFDPNSGELLQGEGLMVDQSELTIDFNGATIRSSKDIGKEGEALGFDVENHGVLIGGSNNTVLNSASTPVYIEGFTINYDFSGSIDTKITGGQYADGSWKMVSGPAAGASGFKIDGGNRVTVDGVKTIDVHADGVSGFGINRSQDIIIRNSWIEGQEVGMRVRLSTDVLIENNKICGYTFDNVELAKENSWIVQQGNAFCVKPQCPTPLTPYYP